MAVKEIFERNTAIVNTANEMLNELDDRDGKYVWKQLMAESNEFVAYVTADDPNAYPDKDIQGAYWYELLGEDDGSIQGALVRVFVQPTAPTNPKEDDIWVKYHEIDIDKLVIQNERPEVDPNTTYVLVRIVEYENASSVGYRQTINLVASSDITFKGRLIATEVYTNGVWYHPVSYCYKSGEWEFISGIDYLEQDEFYSDFYYVTDTRRLYRYSPENTKELMLDDTLTGTVGLMSATLIGVYTRNNKVISISKSSTASSWKGITCFDTISKQVEWAVESITGTADTGETFIYEIPDSDSLAFITLVNVTNTISRAGIISPTGEVNFLAQSGWYYRSAYIDKNKVFHVLSQSGAYRTFQLNDVENTIENLEAYSTVGATSGEIFMNLHRLRDGRLIATTKTRVVAWNNDTKKWEMINENLKAPYPSKLDCEGNVWTATNADKGLHKYSLLTGELITSVLEPDIAEVTAKNVLQAFIAIEKDCSIHMMNNKNYYHIDKNGVLVKRIDGLYETSIAEILRKEPNINNFPEFYY